MPARQEARIIADHVAEHIFAPRPRGEGEIALLARVVDQQLRLFDLGEGIAAFAERDAQFQLALDDAVGIKWVARLDAEGLYQPAGIGLGKRGEFAKVDAPKAVARARQDVEAHARLARGGLGLFLVSRFVRFARTPPARKLPHNFAAVIAIGAQDIAEQLSIGARAGGELRRGLHAIVKLAQGRQVAKPVDEFLLLGEGLRVSGQREHQRGADPRLRELGSGGEHGRIDAGKRLELGIGRELLGIGDRQFGERGLALGQGRAIGCAFQPGEGSVEGWIGRRSQRVERLGPRHWIRHAACRPALGIGKRGFRDQRIERIRDGFGLGRGWGSGCARLRSSGCGCACLLILGSGSRLRHGLDRSRHRRSAERQRGVTQSCSNGETERETRARLRSRET